MAFKDKIRQTDEFRSVAGQANQAQPANEGADALLQAEKTDIEFWMQVATVILLFLIWRELSKANGRAAIQGIANGGGA